MRRVFSTLAVFSVVAGSVTSVQAQVPEAVQRSSSPSGIRIQGDGAARASAEHGNVNPSGAVSATENNPMTASGPAKGGVKIQGNTRIEARGRDLNAITTGKDSKAGNAVGTIGDR